MSPVVSGKDRAVPPPNRLHACNISVATRDLPTLLAEKRQCCKPATLTVCNH